MFGILQNILGTDRRMTFGSYDESNTGKDVPHFSPDSDNPLIRCTFCGKTFARKASLKRHSLIHLGIYPFECMVCNRRFRQKQEGVIHVVRAHVGVDPDTAVRADKTV